MIRPENRRVANDTAELIDKIVAALGTFGELRSAQDALTASATVEHGRITVVVNASGSLVRTVYAEGIEELGYGRIARATVRAAQAAAAEVERKKKELLGPLTEMRRSLMPAEELPSELAALRAQIPEPARAPLTPPEARATGRPPATDDRILDR